jgi:acyl carrier protein
LDSVNIPDNFDLFKEGIIDSLGVLEMIGSVEREFGVALDMEGLDAEQLTILGPFCQYAAMNGKSLP